MFKKSYALGLVSALGLAAFIAPVETAAAASPYVQSNSGMYYGTSPRHNSGGTWNNNQGLTYRHNSGGSYNQQFSGSWNKNHHSWNNNGGWNDNHWNHRHHRGFNEFGVFVDPLIIGGGYGYGSGYYGGSGSAHVRWCLDHYRSYNPEDNTFVGYDGDVHFCHSPFRY